MQYNVLRWSILTTNPDVRYFEKKRWDKIRLIHTIKCIDLCCIISWSNCNFNFELVQGIKLQQCVNSSLCLQKKPKLVVGLRGSTSDIFVDNAAYRDFLFKTFNVSSSDMESSAVVMASYLFIYLFSFLLHIILTFLWYIHISHEQCARKMVYKTHFGYHFEVWFWVRPTS